MENENIEIETNIIKNTNFNKKNNKTDILKKMIIDNPFPDEFDATDVVNRINVSDFIFEDLQKIKQERIEEEKRNKKEQFYISKKELSYLINENPRLNILKRDAEGNMINIEIDDDSLQNELTSELRNIDEKELIEISIPVNKKKFKEQTLETEEQSIKNDGYYYHTDDYDEEDDYYYISPDEIDELQKKEKMQATLKIIQGAIEKLSKEKEYINSEEEFREFLQDNFKDYLLVKNISGNKNIKFSDKILPKEKINKDNEKIIEVTDLHNKHTVSQQKTSVIINRNEHSDIESIDVFCKCGEKTIIRFQEHDPSDTTDPEQEVVKVKSNTDIVIDDIEIEPIYKNEETNEIIKYEDKIIEEEIKGIERIN